MMLFIGSCSFVFFRQRISHGATDEVWQDEFDESLYDIQFHEDWRRKPRTWKNSKGKILFTWRPITGKDEMDGWTPLHLACYYDRVRDVDKYVDNSKPPDSDSLGHPTAALSQLSIQPKTGAPVQPKAAVSKDSTCSKDSSLDQSVLSSSTAPAVNKLIKYEYSGNHINTQTEDGETPLFVACQQGHASVVRKLLEYKDFVDVNLQDNNKRTPLFVACEEGHLLAVSLLLRFKKTDVDLRDVQG
jgi:ankyrin repeat protein